MNVWNKGLTKETDKRVLSYVREGSLSHLFKSGRKLHKGYWYLHKSIIPAEYHSMIDKGNRILEHRLLYAKYIGRCLHSEEHIHHKDGNKLNNEIENLEITTRSAHIREHMLNNKYGRNCRKWNYCLVCGDKHHSKGICSKHHPQFWRRNTMSMADVITYLNKADRLLARAIFDSLPEEHKYLYEEYMKDK